MRHGSRTSATGHPASATARTNGRYAWGSTPPPGMNTSAVWPGATPVGMNTVAPSRSVTATVDDETRTSVGTPCACMFQITQRVNATPAAAQTILKRRRTFFQSTRESKLSPNPDWLFVIDDLLFEGRITPTSKLSNNQ